MKCPAAGDTLGKDERSVLAMIMWDNGYSPELVSEYLTTNCGHTATVTDVQLHRIRKCACRQEVE